MNTRSHSVKKPGPVLRGTLSHAIRREFPTPHPISEFSSRTDESASSPGCSSSAKLGDLRAGSSCRARTAPRYGEALVVVSSRNQNPDFASTGPRYGTFARLGLKACVCVPCHARIETSGPGWSRGLRQRTVGPCLVEFDAKIMISHHF